MLLRSVAFFVTYIAATGALMYANTTWFGLGDIKFGPSGWELYWPLWVIFYAPLAITALIAVAKSRRSPREATALTWIFLTVILVAMEISFALDINLLILVLESLALGIFFFAVSNWDGNVQLRPQLRHKTR